MRVPAGARVVGLKRLDPADDHQPVAKCARLSPPEPRDAPQQQRVAVLGTGTPPSGTPAAGTSPGSPAVPPHQGPSRIGPFLLLPRVERDGVHGALNTDTGDELVCKVRAEAHCAMSLNEALQESVAQPPVCVISEAGTTSSLIAHMTTILQYRIHIMTSMLMHAICMDGNSICMDGNSICMDGNSICMTPCVASLVVCGVSGSNPLCEHVL